MSVWPIPPHVMKTLIVPTARALTPALANRDSLEMEHLVKVSGILLVAKYHRGLSFTINDSLYSGDNSFRDNLWFIFCTLIYGRH